MTTYVFPGQGSQIKGMGKDLFNQFPELIEIADTILGYSLKNLCLNDPQEQLNQTQYTQPALYTVNTLTYLAKLHKTGLKPRYVAGHSLGEYNALFTAGVFDFETGLKLIKKRGELMSQAEGGAMAAIIGLRSDDIKKHLIRNYLNNVTVANNNSNTQIVISGKKEEIDMAQIALKNAGAALVIPLKVSGAFHSPLMKPAQIAFEDFLKDFYFSSPTIPVIANVSARPYLKQDIKLNLLQQITHPVCWTQSVTYMLEQGETEFEEIGPGLVLTKLIQRIKDGQ